MCSLNDVIHDSTKFIKGPLQFEFDDELGLLRISAVYTSNESGVGQAETRKDTWMLDTPICQELVELLPALKAFLELQVAMHGTPPAKP